MKQQTSHPACGASWAGSQEVVGDAFFPILPWDRFDAARGRGMASLQACHFNLAGFIEPEHVADCERHGLKAIGDLGVTRREWVKLSEAEIDRRVSERIAAFGASDAVIGYYLCDEPEIEEFETQGRVVAAVRRHAPGKLAYINLFPEHHKRLDVVRDHSGYSYADYLEVFIEKVRPQFISYDNYTVQYSMNLRDARRGASYFRNLATAREVSLRHGLPFWNIVAGHQLRPYAVPPSFANLLLQANTTLAAGGRSVAWYQYGLPRAPAPTCYAQAAADAHGRLTPTWRWLQEVNRQLAILGPVMNRMVSTGLAFSAPVFDETLPNLPGRRVVRCTGEMPEAIEDPNAPLPAVPPPSLKVRSMAQPAPLMVGEFRDAAGADYAMIVNLSLEQTARITLDLADGGAPEASLSTEDGTWIPHDEAPLRWLTPGEGRLLRLCHHQQPGRAP